MKNARVIWQVDLLDKIKTLVFIWLLHPGLLWRDAMWFHTVSLIHRYIFVAVSIVCDCILFLFQKNNTSVVGILIWMKFSFTLCFSLIRYNLHYSLCIVLLHMCLLLFRMSALWSGDSVVECDLVLICMRLQKESICVNFVVMSELIRICLLAVVEPIN